MTSDSGASVIFSFTVSHLLCGLHYLTFGVKGDVVSLFGTIGPSQSPYLVSVDGGEPSTFSGTKRDFTTQVLLYHADSLGPGPHTLNVTNQPVASLQSLSIDYAVVSTVSEYVADCWLLSVCPE